MRNFIRSELLLNNGGCVKESIDQFHKKQLICAGTSERVLHNDERPRDINVCPFVRFMIVITDHQVAATSDLMQTSACIEGNEKAIYFTASLCVFSDGFTMGERRSHPTLSIFETNSGQVPNERILQRYYYRKETDLAPIALYITYSRKKNGYE